MDSEPGTVRTEERATMVYRVVRVAGLLLLASVVVLPLVAGRLWVVWW